MVFCSLAKPEAQRAQRVSASGQHMIGISANAENATIYASLGFMRDPKEAIMRKRFSGSIITVAVAAAVISVSISVSSAQAPAASAMAPAPALKPRAAPGSRGAVGGHSPTYFRSHRHA